MKASVNDEFGSSTDLFNNNGKEKDVSITNSNSGLPRTMTVTKDCPTINAEDMDSAMMSMLAMNQGNQQQ